MTFPFLVTFEGGTFVKRSQKPETEDEITERLLSNSVIMNTRGFGIDQFGDEMIRFMNLSTEAGYDGRGIGNFDHNDFLLYKPSNGYTEWGAISGYKTQTLGQSEIDYLKRIQPNDFDVNAKMNWLIGGGRPYWKVGTNDYRYGTMVFGHSKIRVESTNGKPDIYTIATYMPRDGSRLTRRFCKVVGFRKYMMNLEKYSVQWLLNNAFIQIATQANAKPVHNTIVYADRGIKYHPVWDFSDWKGNSPAECEYYIWADSLYF